MRHILKSLAVATATLILAMTTMGASKTPEAFITVGDDGRMYCGDSVYRFAGTNFWYGPILASEGPGGNRDRLHRELDRLQQAGITNLRILAGAEGPEGLPHHISPVLQTSPGEYNDTLLAGLDYLMAELESRHMKAVIYLTNSWEWSGGYGSYLQWTGHGVAPVPGIDGYNEYVAHVKDFVLDTTARNMAIDHARFMASRTNRYTGRPYAESPAIMAWQVANEPRAFSAQGKEALASWIRDMARAIKSADPNHMVSTGSEGKYGCEVDLDLWTRIHAMPEIDYAIIHLWPTNWGWASRDSVEAHVDRACDLSARYIDEHLKAIAPYGKPLVIEEFGYPRDGFSFSLSAPVTARDIYYRFITDRCRTDNRISGFNFWGWAGEAVPSDTMWHPGAPYTCDPAHEPQGMYSVFAADSSTVDIICGK